MTIKFLRRSSRRGRSGAGIRKLRRNYRPIARERARGFEAVRRELGSRGWTFTSGPGGAAPVQAFGRLPSGQAFYLRCRYDSCSLAVKAGVEPTSDELLSEPDWVGKWASETWSTFDASGAGPTEVRSALLALEAEYLATRGGS